MMKKALAIASSLLFFSNSALAVSCYSLPHGENGQGSKHSVKLPPITSAYGSDSDFQLTIRNQGTRNFNIKVRFYDENGLPFVPSNTSLDGNFSVSNNPVTDVSGGGAGFLTPENIGVLRVDNNEVDTFTAEITWQTDACLTFDAVPLIVNAEHYYLRNGQYFKTAIPVNSGNIL